MSGLDPSTRSGRREADHPGQPDPRLGLTVTHRRYVPYSHAHYAGNLVDGAYSLGLFGDVATEVCIRTDGDEGLFASYSDVQFRGPVRAGDVLEVSAEVVRVGSRSRTLEFRAVVVARGRPEVSASAAEMLDEPVVATTATGVVVVPTRPGPEHNGVS
jgi:3-aminobutyryl-CoA ammonia-lyase